MSNNANQTEDQQEAEEIRIIIRVEDGLVADVKSNRANLSISVLDEDASDEEQEAANEPLIEEFEALKHVNY